MSNFREFDRETRFLLPPSLDEWLPEQYLARFVVEVIDGLDLSAMVKSYPERAYAKWLVLNFVWTHLDPLCRAKGRAEAFRRACETDDRQVVGPSRRAITAVYREALRFIAASVARVRRRWTCPHSSCDATGTKEFSTYWRGSENKSRSKFNRAWAKFREALKEEMAG